MGSLKETYLDLLNQYNERNGTDFDSHSIYNRAIASSLTRVLRWELFLQQYGHPSEYWSSLSDPQKIIIRYYYLEGETQVNVAKRIGISRQRLVTKYIPDLLKKLGDYEEIGESDPTLSIKQKRMRKAKLAKKREVEKKKREKIINEMFKDMASKKQYLIERWLKEDFYEEDRKMLKLE